MFLFYVFLSWQNKKRSHLIQSYIDSDHLVSISACSCSILSLVSNSMGDYLRAGKLSHYVTSHPGQLTLPSLWGSVNEYQLKLGRQRQVWLIPIADERVGMQVKL